MCVWASVSQPVGRPVSPSAILSSCHHRSQDGIWLHMLFPSTAIYIILCGAALRSEHLLSALCIPERMSFEGDLACTTNHKSKSRILSCSPQAAKAHSFSGERACRKIALFPVRAQRTRIVNIKDCKIDFLVADSVITAIFLATS